jgi:hypothetical protein
MSERKPTYPIVERAVDAMSMQLAIRPDADLLRVVATGKFSLKEAKRTFVEMMEEVAANHCSKVLHDGSQLVGNVEAMERFYYGEFAAQSVANYESRGVSRATKFAYVLHEPVLDPRRFGETVAINRGMFVKCFEKLQDACEWLDVAAD